MAAKLAAFFITLLINVVTGFAIFFFMLLAMNGFSESDATYGIGAYIVLAMVVGLAMSAGAAFTVYLLAKRGFRSGMAVLCAVPLFSVVGAGLNIVCSIIGVLVADYVSVHY
jgi:hypothetical protein